MNETMYLRFDSEEAWRTAAEATGVLTFDEEGGELWQLYTFDHAIDVVGVIWEGGEWDPETGEELVAPVAIPGFHINCKHRGMCPMEFMGAMISTPATPSRKFAGD